MHTGWPSPGGDIKACAASPGEVMRTGGSQPACLPTTAATQPPLCELTQLKSPKKSNHHCPTYLELPVGQALY